MTPFQNHNALKILHLEDSELDHELVCAHLIRGGLSSEVIRVDSEADFLQVIHDPASHIDVIISDYNLPGFSGLLALEWLKADNLDLPFLLVSGQIGEDTAVEAMRNGASDYILKNNLTRLVPAVLHAFEACVTRRARRQADLELQASKQRLQELAQHLQTSIELERAAIAREIHDDVGGALTALKLDLAWISRRMNAPEISARMEAALETVSHAIEASQRIMHNLRPAILEQGLVAALQWMTGRFEKRSGISCRLRLPAEILNLPAGVPLVAYRTAQEALTNISKHAQASHVEIDLSLAGGVLSLEVSDNGRGLNLLDLSKVRSFGIRGLQERARTVGGWVDISSTPRGTTLILSVPLFDQEVLIEHPGESHAVPKKYSSDPTDWGGL